MLNLTHLLHFWLPGWLRWIGRISVSHNSCFGVIQPLEFVCETCDPSECYLATRLHFKFLVNFTGCFNMCKQYPIHPRIRSYLVRVIKILKLKYNIHLSISAWVTPPGNLTVWNFLSFKIRKKASFIYIELYGGTSILKDIPVTKPAWMVLGGRKRGETLYQQVQPTWGWYEGRS